MRLAILAPQVAYRDCKDCMAFMYDETTGAKNERRGRPVKRLPNCPPPCRTSKGCPKVAPTGEPGCVELSAKNLQAYRHNRRCRAVGRFPHDATVEENATVIAMAEEAAEEAKRGRDLGLLMPLLLGGKAR